MIRPGRYGERVPEAKQPFARPRRQRTPLGANAASHDGFRSRGRVVTIAKGMRTPMRIQTHRHHTKCAIAAASKFCRLRVSRETRVKGMPNRANHGGI
eukprot:COSAG06_NODE_22819_length_711_cov_2.743464_2_plen_98_part_00